jgi:hypothetical protein
MLFQICGRERVHVWKDILQITADCFVKLSSISCIFVHPRYILTERPVKPQHFIVHFYCCFQLTPSKAPAYILYPLLIDQISPNQLAHVQSPLCFIYQCYLYPTDFITFRNQYSWILLTCCHFTLFLVTKE